MEIEFDKIKQIFGPVTERIFLENLRNIVKNDLGPKFVDKIMEKFDEFSNNFNSMYGQSDNDPTSPGKWREEIENKLRSEIETNLRVDEGRIVLELGEKKFLGYDNPEAGDSKSSTPVVWAVYFLEGLSGEYAFVDEQLFRDKREGDRRRGYEKDDDISDYGRFGEGFLIPMHMYMAEGWNELKPFEEARFPTVVPTDFFMNAAEEFSKEVGEMAQKVVVEAFIAALQGKTI